MRVILFNLVPYRNARLRQHRFIFLGQVALSLFLALILAWLVTSDLDERLKIKRDFLNQLTSVQQQIAERAALAESLREEKVNLERRVKVLESVDRRSLSQSQLFAELDADRPEVVSFSELSLKDRSLSIVGVTSDLPVLSRWVSRLKTLGGLFKEVVIVEVADLKNSRRTGVDLNNFSGLLHQFRLELELQPVLPDESEGKQL